MWHMTLYWSISSIVLCEEAEKLWLSVEIVCKEKNLFYIHGKEKSILFKSTDFGGNSSLWYKLADDKQLSYVLLEKKWMPIAKSVYISKADLEKADFDKENLDDISNLHFPLVIKPIDEWHGNGVMMGIQSLGELKSKLTLSFEIYDTMIIQEQISGDEVRVLVVKWEVILAIRRFPAHVVWNGADTIEQLIHMENTTNSFRGIWYESPLAYIPLDDEVISYLVKQWRTVTTIPDNWAYIQLRWNSNLWTWWTAKEVTQMLCNEIKNMCIEISVLFGLDIAWIDILSTDFSLPLAQSWGVILEVNASPGIWWDRELTSVNTWHEILKRLFF